MNKLLTAFQAAPTDANRARLAKYLANHMMAVCMATPAEIAFLRANNFKGI